MNNLLVKIICLMLALTQINTKPFHFVSRANDFNLFCLNEDGLEEEALSRDITKGIGLETLCAQCLTKNFGSNDELGKFLEEDADKKMKNLELSEPSGFDINEDVKKIMESTKLTIKAYKSDPSVKASVGFGGDCKDCLKNNQEMKKLKQSYLAKEDASKRVTIESFFDSWSRDISTVYNVLKVRNHQLLSIFLIKAAE